MHGADALAVGAGGDDDALAGLEELGGLVDGFEGVFAGAGAGVAGLGGLVVDVVGLGEFERLFPGGILGAVGQAAVGRGLGGGVVGAGLGEGASVETGHGGDAGGVLQKAAAVDLQAWNLVDEGIMI